MTRRRLLAVVVGLGALPGCGMGVRKLDAEALVAATTAARSFPESSHRVALAAFEVMRAELASAEFVGNAEFAPHPRPRDGALPANFPAFRLEWTNEGKPVRALVTLQAIRFEGKARAGRPVEVGVSSRAGETLATIHVDKLGDRMFCGYLFDRIAHRLAHPDCPPGSPDEAAAFQAFFGGVESREALLSSRRPAPSGP